MTESTIQHGPSSIVSLAADEPSFEDGPWTVHGIALGEGDETKGVTETRIRWPREALEDAADKLEGKKLTDGRNHEDLTSGQPPTSAIIGEVTEARYQEGVGIVYRGEVDDPEIAKLIQRDRVDVSPVIAFDATEADDGEVLVAQSIEGFRDLAVVAEGAAPSNDISPGSGPLATAAAAALSATFTEALKSVAGVSFEGTSGGKLDESAIPSDGFESHYLFPGDTKSDSSYPVVDGSGNLRRGNVKSAFSVGARGGVSESELHSKLRKLNDEFENPPIDAEKLEAAQAANDDPTGASSSGRDSGFRTMTEDDLTDRERELLAAARQRDDPAVIEQADADRLAENEALIDAAEGTDSPTVVNEDELDDQLESLREFRNFFKEALAEQKDVDPDMLRDDVEALTAPFRDDDDELDFEALSQEPEVGGTAPPDESEDVDLDALQTNIDANDRDEAVEALQSMHEQYRSVGWESNAQEVARDLETLGVEVSD